MNQAVVLIDKNILHAHVSSPVGVIYDRTRAPHILSFFAARIGRVTQALIGRCWFAIFHLPNNFQRLHHILAGCGGFVFLSRFGVGELSGRKCCHRFYATKSRYSPPHLKQYVGRTGHWTGIRFAHRSILSFCLAVLGRITDHIPRSRSRLHFGQRPQNTDPSRRLCLSRF